MKNSSNAPTTTEIAIPSKPGGGESAIAVLAYDPGDYRALIQDIYGGVPQLPDFERISMPADGETHFTITTPAGEEHPRTLRVVLLQATRRRAFWSKPYSGTGVPPDCKSADGRVGEGDPGGDCALCPNAQFTDDGGAPRCRESLDLVHYGINEEQPSVLDVHKMSTREVERYIRQLRKYRLAPHAVVTELGLVEAKYRNGFAYTRLTLRTVTALSPADRARMTAIAAACGLDLFDAPPNAVTRPVAEVVEAEVTTQEPPEADVPF